MPFTRQEFFEPVGFGSGAARVHSGTAALLEQFRDTTERITTPLLADMGAQAGATAGAARDGGTRLPVGPYNRAYNEAFLRAYTLDVYADTEEDFLRLEQEAKGDPDLFVATATKRRDAILAEIRPEARAFVQSAIGERMAAAHSRLLHARIEADVAETRQQTIRGLTAMSRDASRLFSSGVATDAGKAQALAQTYFAQVDAAVADGTLTAVEGAKLTDEALKANAWDLEIGRFQAALDHGGDPVAVLRDALRLDHPAFDDETRQKLAGEMYRRLGMAQSLARADEAALAAGRAEMWASTEREATLRLLNGTLSSTWLAQQVRTGVIDPALARSLRDSDHGGGGEDDPDTVLDLEANWRRYTVEEVIRRPGLSDKTRAEYVGKIATREADWRDSDEYQEGSRTIARELGVSLENLGLADQPTKTKLNIALTRFDRDLSAMPPEERSAAAVAKADEIVRTILRGETVTKIETARARLTRMEADFLAQAGVDSLSDLSDDERTRYDRLRQWREKELADLEASLGR